MKTYPEILEAFYKKKKAGKKIAMVGYILLLATGMLIVYGIIAFLSRKSVSPQFVMLILGPCLLLLVPGIICSRTGEKWQTSSAPRPRDAQKEIAKEAFEENQKELKSN